MPTLDPNKCYLCSEPSIGTCARCNKPFCLKDTSRIDPKFCNECMRDVQITEDEYIKTETEWDEDSDSLITHTSKCKQINFRGIDWMFVSQYIGDLKDEELKPVLEYHRAFVYQLESEILERHVKRNKQLQVLPGNSPRKIKTIQTTKAVRKRVSKIVDVDALLQMAVNLGITSPEQLKNFITGANK